MRITATPTACCYAHPMATDHKLLRLLQLASPQFPVGAYAYSQGLEWAVEAGAVRDEASARDWIIGLLQHTVATTDVPLLARLQRAWQHHDTEAVLYWSRFWLASRESAELRAETVQLGRACARVLASLGISAATPWSDSDDSNFIAMFALAAAQWDIATADAAQAYSWTWCENQTICAMKLVPLGQTAGQRLLDQAIAVIPAAVAAGLACADDDIGFLAPGLARAAALHETQYTRLFRS